MFFAVQPFHFIDHIRVEICFVFEKYLFNIAIVTILTKTNWPEVIYPQLQRQRRRDMLLHPPNNKISSI